MAAKKNRTSLPFAEHRTCVTLTELSTEQLPSDGSIGRRRKFRNGTEVWQPEDRADRIYFLERGEIGIFSGDVNGRDLLLQIIRPSEPFGELCLCAEEGGLRRTFARACADAVVVEIAYEVFVDYLRRTPDAVTSLVCTFCLRLTDCETRSEVLAHRGAQERLGRLLLQLAGKRFKAKKSADAVVVRASHLELARMAAMSRPHVTLTLGHFRDRGLIRYGRGSPLAVRREALTAYLESVIRIARRKKPVA
jgi:CRP/FNR family transcriptional regulator, cyclic AMP receptor protein